MTTLDPRAPLAITRRASLIEALQEHGTLRVSELAEILGVTPVTVRRDVAQLAQEGVVSRVHGGATLLSMEDDVADSNGAATQPPIDRTDVGAVGMLVPSLNYYWPGVVAGARETAQAHELRIVLRGSSYEADDTTAQLTRLLDHGVSGLLIAPNMDAPHTADALEWLVSTDVPVVLIERTAVVGPHAAIVESVVSDHALGASMAVRHLVGLGHRKVGLLASRLSPTTHHLHRGWLDASADCGIASDATVDDSLPNVGGPGWLEALDQAIERCRRTRTTAMLVHADTEAIAFVQRCEEQGLSVPQDLSVVAYDDEVAALFNPRLTAVRPPRLSLGRAAVELIAARLADPDRPTHRVVISPSLRVRESSGPPPG